MSYAERAPLRTHPVAKRLLLTMERKKSNLVLSADVTSKRELLALADAAGPDISVLKTHIDIVEDFDTALPRDLRALADKHDFLLFEDRKFADIGSTVVKQYGGGPFRIADWADLVNAHIVPGPGVIEGLRRVGLPKGRALLLLASMSSSGNLATGDYTEKACTFAKEYSDFVIGFICTGKVSDRPEHIHMTPGVHAHLPSDALHQSYLSPHEVIVDRKSDLIIVGRGIYATEDPKRAARFYREAGWMAYEKGRSALRPITT